MSCNYGRNRRALALNLTADEEDDTGVVEVDDLTVAPQHILSVRVLGKVIVPLTHGINLLLQKGKYFQKVTAHVALAALVQVRAKVREALGRLVKRVLDVLELIISIRAIALVLQLQALHSPLTKKAEKQRELL